MTISEPLSSAPSPAPALCNWIARPIAHRGLHDAAQGRIENSTSAIEAAIAAGYSIEIDLQAASGDQPVVFHDAVLDRLTGHKGPVSARSAAELSRISYVGSEDTILSLEHVLKLVAGRAPLLIEVKSAWRPSSASLPFMRAIISTLQSYDGPFALMSFDPRLMAHARALAPHIPRGLISERFADKTYWAKLSFWQRQLLRHLGYSLWVRPNFIAYDIRAIPALAPWIARTLFNKPLVCWTVRDKNQLMRVKKWADAPIFEHIEI